MEGLIKDIRYGVRSLLKRPSFAAIAIVTLALGIGANTAIFSLVNAVLLRPLPFPEADQLVMVWEDASIVGFPRDDAAPGNYAYWKAQQTTFADMAALSSKSFTLTGDGEPERPGAQAITWNLFPLLGVTPVLGRNFTADEDQPGAGKVTILSHGLWQRRYGSDPEIVGRDIQLDGEKYRVVGVMPNGFQFMQSTVGLWVPATLNSQQLTDHDNHFLNVVGRLKPGVTPSQALAELQTICDRIAKDHPEEAAGLRAVVVPLREQFAGTVQRPLMMLIVGAALVLLIACANIASLQLSRATGRSREIAVRAALGASRARILRQLLAESVLLGCVGGALGLLVAGWSFAVLKQLIPPVMALSTNLKLDLPVLVFAFLVSVVTGILFGLAPAIQASKIDLNEMLKQGGSRTSTGGGNRLRAAFVVAEVAIALVLLVGAGLMIQTVYHLMDQYSFFQPERLLTLRTIQPDSNFRNLKDYANTGHTRRIVFYEDVLSRVNALPGVIATGYTTSVPLAWKGGANGFSIENREPQPGQAYNAIHRQISANYFQTMGIGLRNGRYFTTADNQNSQPVAIINESMAKQYWRDEDPIGRRFKLGVPNAPWLTIVGVVPDIRQMGMDRAVKAEMYMPYSQVPSHPWFSPRDLVIRTNGDPNELVAAVRREIRAADPNQAISNVATMEELLVKETGTRRLGMILLSAFAGLALLLASLGIYGVLSFFVAQQTREIGVRLALGAQLRDVLSLVLKKGMRWTLLGVVIGLGGAFALSRLMTGLLFGVSATDPLTFVAIAVVLSVVALLACYVPARRATKVDPLVALRYE
ncbi:MAG TPA: ABC transporter permease [Pyrinomonadaceae bacterium]|nr:ABC transporter permease [Pyrinomonadaceae bacterium]